MDWWWTRPYSRDHLPASHDRPDAMRVDVASLIVRQHIALIREGIGPRDIQLEDQVVMAQAVVAVQAQDRLRGHYRDTLGDHTLWDSGLLTDDEHKAVRCPCGMFDEVELDDDDDDDEPVVGS